MRSKHEHSLDSSHIKQNQNSSISIGTGMTGVRAKIIIIRIYQLEWMLFLFFWVLEQGASPPALKLGARAPAAPIEFTPMVLNIISRWSLRACFTNNHRLYTDPFDNVGLHAPHGPQAIHYINEISLDTRSIPDWIGQSLIV